MANFEDILNMQADAVEAPKSLPPGKYSATVTSFSTGLSTQKKTPYVEVKFAVDGIIDVQPEYAEAAQAAFGKGAVEQKTSFYLSPAATYRLVEFLEKDLGLPKSKKSLKDLLLESIGMPCALIMDNETSQTGREFVGIKRTAKL